MDSLTASQQISSKKFLSDYPMIVQMRRAKSAPVDKEGAANCVLACRESNENEVYKFQCLVSLILSVQTKDHITFKTTKALLDYGLTIESMLEIAEEDLSKLIYSVSFHNSKAKVIKKLAMALQEKHKSTVPENLEDLLRLPGVGRKIAILFLNECCGAVVGIAVDTHIHKISNRLGWVRTKEPNKTGEELEKIVEDKYWREMNGVLVGFGQEICKSVAPLCEQCLLKDRCEYGKKHLEALKTKKSKKNKGKSKDKFHRKKE